MQKIKLIVGIYVLIVFTFGGIHIASANEKNIVQFRDNSVVAEIKNMVPGDIEESIMNFKILGSRKGECPVFFTCRNWK